MSSLRISTLRPTLGGLLSSSRWAPLAPLAPMIVPATASTPAATDGHTYSLCSPVRRWAPRAATFTTTTARAANVQRKDVPEPIALVPDVRTFLSVIGRNMKQHAAKFPSWEALFTLSSSQLRELGIEPARDRRYLLHWLQRFRDGRFGIGGDFVHVHNGTAVLQVHEEVSEADPVMMIKRVLNVAVPVQNATDAERSEGTENGEAAADAEANEDFLASSPPPVILSAAEIAAGSPVHGYRVVGARAISGPFALPRLGGGSQVQVTEGMWEHKRGRKIDGGERRRAEVQFKRRVAERRAAREREGRV